MPYNAGTLMPSLPVLSRNGTMDAVNLWRLLNPSPGSNAGQAPNSSVFGVPPLPSGQGGDTLPTDWLQRIASGMGGNSLGGDSSFD